jgi:hypothetical protein
MFGAIAQLGERLHGMQEVGGSIPPGSTKYHGMFVLNLVKANKKKLDGVRYIIELCRNII